jgi:ferredoxin
VTSSWRITVDPGRCIGSGVCAATVPDRFQLVDGVSRPVDEVLAKEDRVLDAALSCPTEAITVRDLATGDILAPEE